MLVGDVRMSGRRVTAESPRSLSGRDAADAPLYALHQQPVAFAHRRLPGLRSHFSDDHDNTTAYP